MIKNIVSNWLNILVSIIAVFILYPFFVKTLGTDQYGAWLLISSITGYVALLYLGTPLANVRFITEYNTKKDYKNLNKVVNTSLTLYIIMGLTVFVAGVLFSFIVDKLFLIPPEFIRLTRIALIIAFFTSAMQFPFEILEGLINSFQKFVFFNSVKIVSTLLKIFLVFSLLNYNKGLVVIALILFIQTIFEAFLLYIYIKNKYNFVKFNLNLFDRKILKQIFGYSVYVLLLQLASRLAYQSDPIVIGAFLSASAIVYFSVANNFVLYLGQIIGSISKVLMPNMTENFFKNGMKSVTDKYVNYSQLVFVFTLLFGLVFVLLGHEFIGIWMGDEFMEKSGTILNILILSYVFFLVQRGVAHPILMAISKLKIISFAMLISSLLNVLLSIVLLRYYHLYGVAWGTTISNLFYTTFTIYYMKKILDFNFLGYLFSSVLIPLSNFIVLTLIFSLLKNLFNIDSFWILALSLGGITVVYGLTSFFFVLNVENKSLLKNILGRNT